MTQNSTNSSYSKKTVLILLGLVIFNLVSYNLFVKTGGYDASGNHITYSTERNLSSSLITFLIGLPIVSGIIGLIISVFPNKNKPFDIKFKKGWLVTLISLNGLFSLGLLAIIIMTILGWYPTPYENRTTGEELGNKEKVIAEFKGEIIQLCDSSNYYLDYV